MNNAIFSINIFSLKKLSPLFFLLFITLSFHDHPLLASLKEPLSNQELFLLYDQDLKAICSEEQSLNMISPEMAAYLVTSYPSLAGLFIPLACGAIAICSCLTLNNFLKNHRTHVDIEKSTDIDPRERRDSQDSRRRNRIDPELDMSDLDNERASSSDRDESDNDSYPDLFGSLSSSSSSSGSDRDALSRTDEAAATSGSEQASSSSTVDAIDFFKDYATSSDSSSDHDDLSRADEAAAVSGSEQASNSDTGTDIGIDPSGPLFSSSSGGGSDRDTLSRADEVAAVSGSDRDTVSRADEAAATSGSEQESSGSTCDAMDLFEDYSTSSSSGSDRDALSQADELAATSSSDSELSISSIDPDLCACDSVSNSDEEEPSYSGSLEFHEQQDSDYGYDSSTLPQPPRRISLRQQMLKSRVESRMREAFGFQD